MVLCSEYGLKLEVNIIKYVEQIITHMLGHNFPILYHIYKKKQLNHAHA